MALLKVYFGSHSRVPDILKFKVDIYLILSRVNPTVTRLHLGGQDLTTPECVLISL